VIYCTRLIVLLSLLFSVSACSTKRPEVTLRDMQLAEMNIFETGVDVVFRVHNPLSQPLRVQGARYKLQVEGIALGRGSSTEAFEVPALDSAEQRVRFYVSNFAMFQRLQGLMRSQEVRYKLDGELLLAGRSSLRIKEDGLVDFAFTEPRDLGRF